MKLLDSLFLAAAGILGGSRGVHDYPLPLLTGQDRGTFHPTKGPRGVGKGKAPATNIGRGYSAKRAKKQEMIDELSAVIATVIAEAGPQPEFMHSAERRRLGLEIPLTAKADPKVRKRRAKKPRRSRKTGPLPAMYRPAQAGRSKYTPAICRELRAERGVGRPPRALTQEIR